MENLIQEPVRNTIVQPTLKGSKIGNTASRLRPKSKKSISNFDKSSMYKIQDPIEMSTVTRRYFDNLATNKIIEGIIKRQNAMTPDNERMGLKYKTVSKSCLKIYDFEYNKTFYVHTNKRGAKKYITYDKSYKPYGKWDDFNDINERTEVFNGNEYGYIRRDDIEFNKNSDPVILLCEYPKFLKDKVDQFMRYQQSSQPPTIQSIQKTNIGIQVPDDGEKKSSENN